MHFFCVYLIILGAHQLGQEEENWKDSEDSTTIENHTNASVRVI